MDNTEKAKSKDGRMAREKSGKNATIRSMDKDQE